jgi:hypothetical protein
MPYMPETLLRYFEQVQKVKSVQLPTQLQTKNYTTELAGVYHATTVSKIEARHRRRAASEQRGDRASIRTCQFGDLRY